jgi:carboxymethylenebutenolidase
MMQRFFISLAIALAAAAALSQDWALQRLESSPRHGEWVALNVEGGRKLHCFVVYPEKKEKAPVVIVIHEIYGLTDWVRSLADQLAEAGVIAIAPDLLSGDAPGGGRTKDFAPGEVREAISKLSPERITTDLHAAADYGLKLPASNGNLAVTGFCWGGTQSFRYATNRADLKAAFVFYGSGITDPSPIARIAAPVYGFYAENDARVNTTIPASQEAMKAAGKTFEPVVYGGGGHGFMRAGDDPGGSEANKKARALAWERWKKLLAALM